MKILDGKRIWGALFALAFFSLIISILSGGVHVWARWSLVLANPANPVFKAVAIIETTLTFIDLNNGFLSCYIFKSVKEDRYQPIFSLYLFLLLAVRAYGTSVLAKYIS